MLALAGTAWAAAIGTAQLRNGAITTPKLRNGAVTTPKLRNGAVTAPKLGNAVVTTAKLRDGAVTPAKLGTGAVVTRTIRDGAVTAPKLAPGAVTSTRVASGAVGTAQLGQVPMVRVGQSASQEILHASPTPLTWSQVHYQGEAAIWDAANPELLTAPVDGLYHVFAQVELSGTTSNGAIELNLQHGRPEVFPDVGEYSTHTSFQDLTGSRFPSSTLVPMRAGDFVGLRVGHTQGAPRLTVASRTHITMVWVAHLPDMD